MSDPEGGRFGNPRDVASPGFKNAPSVRAELNTTKPLADIRVDDFDAIFVVGGFGPPTTFIGEEPLHRLFAAFHGAGKVAAAICHGTCILLRTRAADGTLLAAGRRWTGYTDAEEDVVDRVMGRRFQPFRIQETALRGRIGTFVEGPPYRPHAVADGNLITGQQSSSGLATAELVLRALG
jgi:putative intracellular protease/amidase